MENHYNMGKKEDSEKVSKIITEHSISSNKELIFAMDYIKEDFDLTKDSLIKLTHHLDKLENSYNILLKEFQQRTNQK